MKPLKGASLAQAIGRLNRLTDEEHVLLKRIVNFLREHFCEFAEIELDVAKALELAPEFRWDHRIALTAWRLFELFEGTFSARHGKIIAENTHLSRQVIHIREAFESMKRGLDHWIETPKEST